MGRGLVSTSDPWAAAEKMCLVGQCFKTSHLVSVVLQQVTVGALMAWTRDNLIKQRPELFMRGETVWVDGFLCGFALVPQ